MKLKINDFMQWDMIGYFYFVVYVKSRIEWYILHPADTLEEAQKYLAEENDKDIMIIDYNGKVIKPSA